MYLATYVLNPSTVIQQVKYIHINPPYDVTSHSKIISPVTEEIILFHPYDVTSHIEIISPVTEEIKRMERPVLRK